MTKPEGRPWQQRISTFVRAFNAPRKSLGNLDADSAAELITAAADVALVMEGGTIRDIAINNEELSTALGGCRDWTGRRLTEVVTVESRPKAEALLNDAMLRAEPRWRHLNHAVGDAPDVPVLYSALRLGEGESARVVVIGRDLRAISLLQQRLVAAQQSMEDDYTRLQHLELRYRLLFQTSAEAVLILDASSQRVLEANPASITMFGEAAKRIINRSFLDMFDPGSRQLVQALLNGVRAAGRADDVRARIAEGERDVTVSAAIFRQNSSSLFLVRLSGGVLEALPAELPKAKSKMLKLVESAPDGFVVTGADGRIMAANASFLDMAQLASEEIARGEPLERWVGRPGVDVDVLMANLRQRGSIRLFATTLNGELGAASDVEVSAVSVMNGGGPCFGFTIRNVARRLAQDTRAARQLPRSVEQLTELIGRVPLKDLVRETTDVIERLCIEAALELTNDNRASAAEMLGLSRQSLYVKLRRYGLADATAGEGED